MNRSRRAAQFAGGWLALAFATSTACARPPRSKPEPVVARAADGLLPALERRLSNAEYERTLEDLLEIPADVATRLPPDIRQNGFSRNVDQPVPAAFAARLVTLTEELAGRAVTRHGARWFSLEAEPSRRAESFVRRMGRRAFRRPLNDGEVAGLVRLFDRGRELTGNDEGGMKWVLVALLQSPSLLYVSERGTVDASGRRRLTSIETASVLSYTLRGGPPDDSLLDVAESGALLDVEVREREARRLLGASDSRHHFRRFVLEWLEVDGLARTAKVPDVAPDYDDLKLRMLNETESFVDEVMVHRGASIASLLNGEFASVDARLARFYGFDAYGPRVDSRRFGRVGLLQHGSFLAAHAHPDGSSPIKRGDFVLRRLLCVHLPRPQELDIEVVIPPPNDKQTTRERFSVHQSGAGCRSCHDSIDPLGFAFENFDAAGRVRSTENGSPITTAVEFEHGSHRARFADSVELSAWLANEPATRACFSREAFRYFTGSADAAAEKSFERVVHSLPEPERDNLIEELVAFVRSDFFVLRKEPT